MDQSDRPLEVMVDSGTYVKEKSLTRLAVSKIFIDKQKIHIIMEFFKL